MTTLLVIEENGDEPRWTLQELSVSCALQPEFIVQCVEFGLLEASGQPPEWRFNSSGRLLLQKAWRLHRDLEVQVNALPLVLQLLDELDELRQEVQHLRVRLRHWEDGQH